MINYIQNDKDQLKFLGLLNSEIKLLEKRQLGFDGNTRKNRINNYFKDLKDILKECHRVLKEKAPIIIIIGFPKSKMDLFFWFLTNLSNAGFSIDKTIKREIFGIQNKLEYEYLVYARKK